MRDRLLLLLISTVITYAASANHLKGGWIQYEYLGNGAAPNTSKYQITVRQYLDSSSINNAGQRDAQVFLGIFNTSSNALITTLSIVRSSFTLMFKTTFDPCISGRPKANYIIDIYTTQVDLPDIAAGYTLAVQRCCRINGIVNVSPPSNAAGITYSTTIPGNINNVSYKNNNSPAFAQKDTVVVCYSSPFTFDFSATDADKDSISYSFCDGLNGGGQGQGNCFSCATPNPPANPPYSSISYLNPYDGNSPMGVSVTINSKTGLITGVAPATVGDYVVGVCASEYRNGVLIGTTKKEIHITVADCSLSAASLKPSYITCDGYTLSFQNESSNSSVDKYLWDFGVTNTTTDTSTNATPTYTYKDTGTYTMKLLVTNTGGCKDSATALVKIYPGFVPAFNIIGSCFFNNYQFKDATTTKYGVVNSWQWDFGDLTTNADTARSKDSVWKYPAPTTAQVRLIVTNSKGCIDTLTKSLNVLDKPSLNLAFKDTLICSIDSVPLKANISSGTISWTVSNAANRSRIINPNTVSPIVFPKDTTKYYVTVNDNGCSNSDTVTVNVLQFITVDAGIDTTICFTDTVQLKPISDALSYKWIASSGEVVQPIKNPLVHPATRTKYYVTANLGYCQAKDSVTVSTAPYPQVSVSQDTTICFNTKYQLSGSYIGSSYFWSPTTNMFNASSLNPIVAPSKSTRYFLTALDTLGCNKPVTASVLVSVTPAIQLNAGKDTFAVPNQPVQLNAISNLANGFFTWTPATGLNNTAIANPIATLDNQYDSITYTVRFTAQSGCFAEDDIKLKLFRSGPDILVPSGFTPNGDGKNDILKPITIAISTLTYFSVYNRWGALLYRTTELEKGWDGKYNGEIQPAGAYVYQTEGIDYLGKKVYRKGTVVLIR
jgi:gliding motility-associated-like protein